MVDCVPELICTETLISCINKFRAAANALKLKAINEGKTMYGGMVPPPKPTTDCPECNGKGKIPLFSHEHPCDNCGGSGKIKKEDNDDDRYAYCGF